MITENRKRGSVAKKLAVIVATAGLISGSISTAASAAPFERAYATHNVQTLWDKGFKGEGGAIAVIDQGVNLDHEYFQGQIVDGICVFSNMTPSVCPNGSKYQTGIEAASQRKENGVLVDRESHGNMVAGLIAGKPNNSAAGGIAPNAKLVMANTDLTISSVHAALEYFYQNREKHNIVAISMSFGLGMPSQDRKHILDCNGNPAYAPLKDVLGKLRKAGIIPFAASGNGFLLNEITLAAPTCLSEVVSIGALNDVNQVSVYTTMNNKVELLGVDYAITAHTTGYRPGSGTSAATPIVAGSYSLLRQAFPKHSPETIIAVMKKTGKKIDDVIRKQIPVVDLDAAYKELAVLTPTASQNGVEAGNSTGGNSNSGNAGASQDNTAPSESSVVSIPNSSFSASPAKGSLNFTFEGYSGKKVAIKVGKTWIVKSPLKNDKGLKTAKITQKVKSGSSVEFQIYIDGKFVTKNTVRIP